MRIYYRLERLVGSRAGGQHYQQTDIKIKSYIICRALHAFLAGLYSAFLAGPIFPLFEKVAIPAFYQMIPTGSLSFWWGGRSLFMFYHLFIFLGGVLIVLALVITLIRRLKIIFFKINASGH